MEVSADWDFFFCVEVNIDVLGNSCVSLAPAVLAAGGREGGGPEGRTRTGREGP